MCGDLWSLPATHRLFHLANSRCSRWARAPSTHAPTSPGNHTRAGQRSRPSSAPSCWPLPSLRSSPGWRGRGWFSQDDLHNFGVVRSTGLSWSYLNQSLIGGHWAPGGHVLIWLVSLLPLNWIFPLLISLYHSPTLSLLLLSFSPLFPPLVPLPLLPSLSSLLPPHPLSPLPPPFPLPPPLPSPPLPYYSPPPPPLLPPLPSLSVPLLPPSSSLLLLLPPPSPAFAVTIIAGVVLLGWFVPVATRSDVLLADHSPAWTLAASTRTSKRRRLPREHAGGHQSVDPTPCQRRRVR